MKKRVVVTGLGVVSPVGIGKENFWGKILKGKSGIRIIKSFDPGDHFTRYGGEVQDFDIDKYVSREKAGNIGRGSSLAVAATKLAIDDAGFSLGDLKDIEVPVSIGTTAGEEKVRGQVVEQLLKKGPNSINKKLLSQCWNDMFSADVARVLGLKGGISVFCTACASGNYAIGHAFDLLRKGEVDVAIAGGADPFNVCVFTSFNALGAVAPRFCRPFDKNRKGMIPSEGAGILILETLKNAKKRKAYIYAEILGYGLSCDAHHMTSANFLGIELCMKNALKNCRLKIDDVDYISAHGTGTIHNDKAESAAIKNVFKDRCRKLPVSSIKSMLGHSMGASSAIEAISCCLGIRDGVMPPTINHKTHDPECDIDCIPNNARKHKIDVAFNNSYAFGGNNACVVFKKYTGNERKRYAG